ncbi:MAG: phage head morphogenesis protein [Rhodospirillaceae bacterium]|nr:MAG: phage head morphogenesis protein [Rhodospirillaceae bacterium]
MKIRLAPLAPKEAVKFFRKKGLAVGFDWRDVWKEEHAAAFTVAKAMRVDILEDIRGAVDTAIAKGVTFNKFKKNLRPVLQAKGWWGRKELIDPLDGTAKLVQLGSDRRLKTIFDTNLRMSYAAGRWERAQRVKKTRPWLRYIAVLDDRTRPQHRDWHGIVRPIDDGFWQTHTPPNGWKCRCSFQQLSDRDLKRFGHKVSKPPKIKTREWLNKRTGEVSKVPVGISPGFDYNVGEARLRAFTPPPRGGLPASFPPGVPLPPLPPARKASKKLRLPDNLKDEAYVAKFLAAFGAKRGKPKIFTDVAGEDLIISENLFRDATGAIKVKKHDRHTQLLLLAETIKDPDEIWWVWEESRKRKSVWHLRRRYIRRWAGDIGAGISVFEHGQTGWTGVTTFPAMGGGRQKSLDSYLGKQRHGTLAWRRKK